MTNDASSLHVVVQGRDDPEAEVVVLSSGLGGAAHYWAPQVADLAQRYKVVAYDHRGTGNSHGALPDPYRIEDMAQDVIDLLAQHAIARCHFVGHALGGLIGLVLARDRPDLLTSLTVVNGWARADLHTKRCFSVRMALLKGAGPAAYIQAQPIFLYPAAWLSTNADRIALEEAAALRHFPGEDVLLRRIGALLAFDIADDLAAITTPTLVVATRDDCLVPFLCSEVLAAGLPQARLSLDQAGGHACNITEPARFNATLADFLSR